MRGSRARTSARRSSTRRARSSWNELASPDLDGSSAFYSELFGWTIEPHGGQRERVPGIKNGEKNNGGMRAGTRRGRRRIGSRTSESTTSSGRSRRSSELGGSALAGPIDIQIAKIAVVSDPQGAVFALYAGQLEP